MKKILLLVSFLCCMMYANAIKVRVTGDLSVLNTVKTATFRFTYDNMIVGKMTESDYLSKKVEEYNKKKEGRGDDYKRMWENDKKNIYPQEFLILMEKGCTLRGDSLPDNKYTVLVNTTFFEPGFNVHVARKNAEISVDIKVVETANPSNVVAEVVILNSPGRTFMGDDYSVSSRVSEAYAKAGKEFAKQIKKSNK